MRSFGLAFTILATLILSHSALAQTSSDQSWAATNQQGSPDGTMNPTRTNESHTEHNGHTVDKTSVERMGPDGRYIPYSDSETETVQVDKNTARTIQRTFGRDADGRPVLIQETQEESHTLLGGEQKVTRTTSAPDANGANQVIRRELEDSKQTSPDVRVTNTTVLTPDGNGGFSPAVQIEAQETRNNDGTVESKKSTRLTDGSSGWKLAEVRETNGKEQNGKMITQEERIFRPDSNGNLALAERKVSNQAKTASGDQRSMTDIYSTNVPGVAGDNGLQLVQRETTTQQTNSAGAHVTTRQLDQPRPGAPEDGLHLTQQAIDIVRPGLGGTADQTSTILTPNADGRLGQVWIDTGKTTNPTAMQVDIGSPRSKQ